MKILVTGANGFLGSEIVSVFSNLSNFPNSSSRLVGIGRQKEPVSKLKNITNFEYFQADISLYKNTQNLRNIGEIDLLIHCAGLAHQFGKVEKEDFWNINVQGTENIAGLAVELNCKRFILISSVAVYGQQPEETKKPIDEKTRCIPKGFYAESKFEAEKIAEKICRENQIPLTILRPATIIGEGDRGNVFRLIKLIDKGMFVWIGKGENFKSLIHKSDVAAACWQIATKSRQDFEVYNLTTDKISMKRIVGEISDNLNKRRRTTAIPEKLVDAIFTLNERSFALGKIKKVAETIKKWKSDEVFSAELIEETYEFSPKLSAKEAIAAESRWYADKK